jgi:hypothetical protein
MIAHEITATSGAATSAPLPHGPDHALPPQTADDDGAVTQGTADVVAVPLPHMHRFDQAVGHVWRRRNDPVLYHPIWRHPGALAIDDD